MKIVAERKQKIKDKGTFGAPKSRSISRISRKPVRDTVSVGHSVKSRKSHKSKKSLKKSRTTNAFPERNGRSRSVKSERKRSIGKVKKSKARSTISHGC